MVSNTVSFQKFQNLLLFLARKRYSLIISKDVPWGHTSFVNKTVEINPLAKGRNEKAQRQIAGIFPGGGTFFSSILKEANQTLAQRQEQYKLLIIFHDGQLNANDTVLVKSEVSNLKRNGILLQPIYIG